MQLLNTLYVTIPESYLHLDNDTVRLEVEHETRLRVPLHHLGAVVCFGLVKVSLPLMYRLAVLSSPGNGGRGLKRGSERHD